MASIAELKKTRATADQERQKHTVASPIFAKKYFDDLQDFWKNILWTDET